MEATHPAYKYIYTDKLEYPENSVHCSTFRFKKAEEQANINFFPLTDVEAYTNKFLSLLPIPEVKYPRVERTIQEGTNKQKTVLLEFTNNNNVKKGFSISSSPTIDETLSFYKEIATYFGLQEPGINKYGGVYIDIVWMHFTTNGYLGVVGASGDIHFLPEEPINEKQYNETTDGKQKSDDNGWKYTTSHIIINHLNNTKYRNEIWEWDESFLYIFPLREINKTGLWTTHVENGIGNYLIDKGVPILDYYSHNF